jgi:hypothetical protein
MREMLPGKIRQPVWFGKSAKINYQPVIPVPTTDGNSTAFSPYDSKLCRTARESSLDGPKNFEFLCFQKT